MCDLYVSKREIALEAQNSALRGVCPRGAIALEAQTLQLALEAQDNRSVNAYKAPFVKITSYLETAANWIRPVCTKLAKKMSGLMLRVILVSLIFNVTRPVAVINPRPVPRTSIFRRFRKPVAPTENQKPRLRDLTVLQNQTDDNRATLTKNLTSLLTTALETYALPAAYVVSLVSSFVSALTAVVMYVKVDFKEKTTKHLKGLMLTNMIASLISFLSTAVLGVIGYATAEFPWNEVSEALTEDLTVSVPAAVEEEKKPKKIVTPANVVYYNDSHRSYLDKCKIEMDNIRHMPGKFRSLFKELYTMEYSTLDFPLPPHCPPYSVRDVNGYPSAFVYDYPGQESRLASILTSWPRWFVYGWYGIENIQEFEAFVACGRFKGLENQAEVPSKDAAEAEDLMKRLTKIVDLFFSKAIAIICTVSSAIVEKKTITPDMLVRSLGQAPQIDAARQDLQSIVTIMKGQDTPEEKLAKQVNEETAKIEKYMEMAPYQFALHPRNIERFKVSLNNVGNLLNTMDFKTRASFPLLQGLYTAGTVKKNELMTTQLPSFQRQEPFVVLLRGEPFVGKTVLSFELAQWAAAELLGEEFQDSFVQITSSDKYWPPLGGQPIAFFDDAATDCDLRNDLLFSNLKGLCSPAYFNAAAADITHKINPVHFKLIFATINPSFDDLAARITAFSDATTWQAICRRMIIVDMTWKDRNMVGQLSRDTTIATNIHQKNFSHANFVLKKMQDGKLTDARHIDVSQLKKLISDTYAHQQQEFERVMRSVAVQSCVKQTAKAKVHYSVVVHGRSGQGKTYTMSNTVSQLQIATGYPLVTITSLEDLQKLPVQKRRVILLMDDIVKENITPELQSAIMDVYNHRLMLSSIIVTLTNVSPKPFSLCCGGTRALVNCSLPFTLEGLARRIGYTEVIRGVQMPRINKEIFMEHFRIFIVRGSKCISYLYCVPYVLVTLVLGYFSLYIAFVISCITIVTVYMTIQPFEVERELTPHALSNEIYEGYKQYLKDTSEVEVRHGHVTRPTTAKFELISDSPDIQLCADPYKMQNHLFYNRDLFEQCTLPWKMFLERDLFQRLMDNYQKFMITTDRMDYDVVLSLVHRYAIGFREIGITPLFYVEIGSVGKFLFDGTAVTAQVSEESDEKPFIYMDGNTLSVAQYQDEQMHFVPVWNLLFQQDTVFNDTKLSITNVLKIREFVRSNEFNRDPLVAQKMIEWNKQERKKQRDIALKSALEYYNKIVSHPLGKVLRVLVILAAIYATVVAVNNLFVKPVKKVVKYIKGSSSSSSDSSSSDSESEDDRRRQKGKKSKRMKGSEKPRGKLGEASDVDTKQKKGKRMTGAKKVRDKAGQDSDPDVRDRRKQTIFDIFRSKKTEKEGIDDSALLDINGMVKPEILIRKLDKESTRKGAELTKYLTQTVNRLCDMNNFDAYYPHVGTAHAAATANLCQLYLIPLDALRKDQIEILDFEPAGAQACYGLFIGDGLLVTVGHVLDEKNMALFCCMDELSAGKKAYRLQLVKSYNSRDLSVWYLSPKVKQFKSLKNYFVEKNLLARAEMLNAVVQRYGRDKKKEFHGGCLAYFQECVPKNNKGGVIGEFGQLEYGTFSIAMTTYGDCGLPYYACEPGLCENKILAVHCMGNVAGHASVGIGAMVFREDYQTWLDALKLTKQTTKEEKGVCCSYYQEKMREVEQNEDRKIVPSHKVVWNTQHESDRIAFYSELEWVITLKGLRNGSIIKNSGKLRGSVAHSHIQYMNEPAMDVGNDHPWRIQDPSDYRKSNWDSSIPIWEKVATVPLDSFLKHVEKSRWGNDFIFYANIENMRDGSSIVRYMIMTIVNPTVTGENQMRMSALTELPLGNLVYASHDVMAIVDRASQEKERGVLGDIPYEKLEDNETVKVIGSFRGTKSHTPTNIYKKLPFADEVDKLFHFEHKEPVEFHLSKIPIEEQLKMVKDNYGEPSPLATQSVQWAHRVYSPPQDVLKMIDEQFYTKIMMYYSDMGSMTDHEVLHGCHPDIRPKDAPYFQQMELNKSVGFTMKELFYVQKKSDVINVGEDGIYRWNDNPAAAWLQEELKQADECYQEGKQVFIAFNELLKMEKLKPAKKYVGRTFLAQDMLGVMLERKYLGEFAIRAMRDDPNCGVGTDPTTNFHNIYMYLRKHPNIWAADYARFDRTLPAVVFIRVRNMLMKCNPKIAKPLQSAFNSIIYRFQVTGRTMTQVYGGMPSGCTVTAPLNSLLNEYVMFACFAMICSSNDKPWNWQLYNTNISRIYYGDDVFMSVSEEYSDVWTRGKVAEVLKENFGMTIDSSSKDGTVADFDTWENASWISRFFRKVDKYAFVTGALKQISINTNLYYTTSLEPDHVASLLDKTILEAALWDQEYFDRIQKCVLIAVAKMPKLKDILILRSRPAIQKMLYDAALPSLTVRNSQDVLTLCKEKATVQDTFSLYCAQRFSNEYHRKVIKPLKRAQHSGSFIQPEDLAKIRMSYVSQLNRLFQAGEITKPKYDYTNLDSCWQCDCSCYNAQTQERYTDSALGASKAQAAEVAAWNVWLQTGRSITASDLPPDMQRMKPQCRRDLTKLVNQMNVAPQVNEKVPSAPMTATDVSVVTDSGLYTNTVVPSPSKIINSVGIALDNPAGTGAPFSKHTAVYDIYQRWESKNTVISPALASGTEILRISLDPKELPQMISSYIDFHDSFLPALDISIAIAGAAGTIGWIATGWVRDASPNKKYGLKDLQQVSMQESNMNGTQIIRITLQDVRRSALYRLTKNDPEPYPGIIMMVDHAVTNVQRNDSVNYPVRVQVRLHPTCLLMEPFSLPNSTPAATFDLGSYFYNDNVDLLVGCSAVANDAEGQVYVTDDNGYNTKDFKPILKDVAAIVMQTLPKNVTAPAVISPDATLSATYAAQIEALPKLPGNSNTLLMPSQIIFPFGQVSALDDFYYVESTPTLLGSVYTVSGDFRVGKFNYKLSHLVAQSDGCYLVAVPDMTIIDSAKHGKLVVYNNVTGQFTQDYLDDASVLDVGKGEASTWIFQDTTHANEAAADSNFLIRIPTARTQDLSLQQQQQPTLPRTFVQTGNSMPSTNLPTGLKHLSFVRAGTASTVADDSPFVPLYQPILKHAFRAFNEMLINNGFSTTVKGDLYINGENKGEIGYQSATFFVRTDDIRKILPGIGSDVKIRNIADLPVASGLTAFNTTGYTSWISSGVQTTRRRVNLCALVNQSAIAGGAISGLGEGISAWSQQMFAQQMQAKLLASNQGIADANNAAIAQRQKDLFERNMQLKGYGGVSAQHGFVRGGVAFAPPPSLVTSTPSQTQEENSSQANQPQPSQDQEGDQPAETASADETAETPKLTQQQQELYSGLQRRAKDTGAPLSNNMKERHLDIMNASMKSGDTFRPSRYEQYLDAQKLPSSNPMQNKFGPAMSEMAGAFKQVNDTIENGSSC